MKRPIGPQLEQLLELPEGILSGEARLVVYGSRRVVVEGERRICEYGEDRIRLETRRGVLCFRGRELRLSALQKQGASVSGYLMSIEFE